MELGGLLLPPYNAEMSCAERGSAARTRQRRAVLQKPAGGEAGSLLAAMARAWAAWAGNQYKNCFEGWEEWQKMD